MTPLVQALERHEPADHREAADLTRVLAMVEVEADPWSRAIPLHLTASALVIDPERARVLLRWHAKQQRWLQVGGHADAGETDPWAIALREATEETALDDLVPWPGPEPRLAQVVIVDVVAAGGEPAHEHADLRYLLATGRPDAVPPEVEGVPLRWCTVADALTVADDGLAHLLRLAPQ
jgi:8-oxo-dGTP pyrophosphatase MutT (NUDIX family)